MDIFLGTNEARVIGCLLEKQRITPEHYPLSLNALTNACNQKSSREPVMMFDETTVQVAIDVLLKQGYVIERSDSGSRVVKYQHRFCNTEFSVLKFSDLEFGVVCVLLLRGPQTPGELRTRTDRLCKFRDIHEVESTLNQLMQREDGPFVAKLPRVTGKREIRYSLLFLEQNDVTASVAPIVSSEPDEDVYRIEQLEQIVFALRDEVIALSARLNQISPDPECDR